MIPPNLLGFLLVIILNSIERKVKKKRNHRMEGEQDGKGYKTQVADGSDAGSRGYYEGSQCG